MYAVGHFALGYLTGKVTAKTFNVDINLPLIFLISVFPDVDVLVPGLNHRGPLHSILAYSLLFLPIFLLYRKKAAPYFVALLQHSLIGDYLTGGTQLLWPVSTAFYGLNIDVTSLTNVALEWFLFLISITVMFKTKDMLSLFITHTSNLILSIPVLAILLPTVISFPLFIPFAMLVPHLVYLTLFGLPILSYGKRFLTKT